MGDSMTVDWRKALFLVSAFGFAATAQAQTAGPATAPTREELNPVPPKREADPAKVSVDSSNAFGRGPCPLDSSDLRTTIPSIQFGGAGGKPLPPELVPLLASIHAPSGEQSVRVVCDIRDAANAALRAARYVATVQIPAQRLDGGPLQLEVVTAHIVETRVRGNAGPYEGLIERRIATLQSYDPLNEAQAERLLLLADDIPGLDVRLSLQPAGRAPGEVIGELTVDYHPYGLVVNAQNYNSKQLGRETVYARAELYGLTGLGDLTYLAGSVTADFKEQKIVQVGHEMLLDQNGTTLALRATYADSRPTLPSLDLRTKSWILNAELTQPLMRSVNDNYYLGVGFERIDQRTDLGGAGGTAALNLDRISTIYLRFVGNSRRLHRDGTEATALNGFVEFRKGIDLFNTTKTGVITRDGYAPSRFEGDAKAWVIRGQLDGKIGLGPIFELFGSGRGQWTNQPLLNYDEFSLGNLTVGRGYDPGANTGDKAYGLTGEIRVNLPTGPRFGTQLFGFYDHVRLFNLDTGSTEKDRQIDSYGGGVRVTLSGVARLDVTYAHPLDPPLLTGASAKVPSDRVLVSLTAQLVPFGLRR
jgi:hemolysin activation/secretion protein